MDWPYGYHDDLVARASRGSDGLSAEPVYGWGGTAGDYHVGRQLHLLRRGAASASANPFDAQGQDRDPFDSHPELLHCHVPILLRYSSPSSSSSSSSPSDFSGGSAGSGDVVGGADLGAIAYAASAGALLALRHANVGDGTVAAALAGLHERCPLRFTAEALDGGGSGRGSVAALTRAATRGPLGTADAAPALPQPCAVVGAHVSDASAKLASLAAAFDLPVVSPSAMAVDLDDPEQHPTFLRTHTDVGGFGTMAVSFLGAEMGVAKFGLLFTNDGYGRGFAGKVLEAAARAGAEVAGGGTPYVPPRGDQDGDGSSEEALAAALAALAETGCNYFVGNFYAESLAAVMGAAREAGAAGPGKFWLVSGTADVAPFVLGGALRLPSGSPAAEALGGSGIYFCEGGVPGLGGEYDRFQKVWNEVGEDPEALDWIDSKQPARDDGNGSGYSFRPVFGQRPHHVVTFSYDAGVGLALSACEAWEKARNGTSVGGLRGRGRARARSDEQPHGAFSGTSHRDAFAASEYRGASGRVEFRKSFPTRTAESSYFVMVNLRSVPDEDDPSTITFKGSPLIYYFDTTAEVWRQNKMGNAFIYPGGTDVPPDELVPLEQEVNSSTIVAAVLLGLMVPLVALLIYMHRQRRKSEHSVWAVKVEELHFDDPPEIIGQGTFGLVLLAEYRGTKVAVKRVIPPKRKRKSSLGSICDGYFAGEGGSSFSAADNSGLAGKAAVGKQPRSHMSVEDISSLANGNQDGISSGVAVMSGAETTLGAFASNGSKGLSSDSDTSRNLGLNSGMNYAPARNTARNTKKRGSINHKYRSAVIGWQRDEYQILKADFIEEMMLLAKLRHPCICTVMGAVIADDAEPMLIMEYLELGSLFGILHNETVPLEGEILLPVLQDVAKGLRFLHAADPAVIHGDLKSANILVDSRMRGKVCDFGLSQKKTVGAAGTPYWMAPELLRGESDNTTASDVYSFGIVLYECFSRKLPYFEDGDNFERVIAAVSNPVTQKRPPVPKNAPPQIQSMMTECIVHDPSDRPTFEELDIRLQRLTCENTVTSDPIRSLQRRKSSSSSAQAGRDILYDNFPKKFADAFREGRKVEPESHSCVSIFFCDIVGYTMISSKVTPLKVSDMLDRLYTSFDDLSRRLDVFKVETIGDAYMAVTNLENPQPDHAKRIVDFACEALELANQTAVDLEDLSLGYVNIRVGIHSGPVVANVVGSRNLKFSIFGDSVNTAARMEQNSQMNRIHMSEATAKLLEQQDESRLVQKRGVINVKGKGDMMTYWATGYQSEVTIPE